MKTKHPSFLIDLMTGMSLRICTSMILSLVHELRFPTKAQAAKASEISESISGPDHRALTAREFDQINRQVMGVRE